MKTSLTDAMDALRTAQNTFVDVINHGTMRVELYKPVGRDEQQPHAQDELYFVISGNGIFRNGVESHPFSAGDVLFVRAGVGHRFERFTEDFATWVVFWGPKGGE